MDGQENDFGATRLGKKRAGPNTAAAAQSMQLPTAKKRAVLGDLTNSPDLGSVADIHNPRPNPSGEDCVEPQKAEGDTSLVDNENSIKVQSTQDLEYDSEKPAQALEKDDVGPSNPEIAVISRDRQKRASAHSIYKHLRSLEIEENRRPFPRYLEEVQADVTSRMREVLVDWLVEVAEEYKLVSDTLYLTVSFIDRFLSSNALGKSKLQLLGISCMLIASRYEEICPPHVDDFCYITDNTYTKEEVVNMERDVLNFFSFQLSTPTTKNFLRLLTRAAQGNCKSSFLQFEFLSCYLAELSLLDYRCLQFLPSVIAASAIFLSKLTIQPSMHPWSSALQFYSGYKPSDLKECILALSDLQLNRSGSTSRAVRDKYLQPKFKCVAELLPPSEIPARYFDPNGG